MEIRIKNFQAISEGEIDIEGLTLVVGETSAGKSSTVRAIVAATLNKFRSGYVRNGEKSCTIDIDKVRVNKKDGGSTSYEMDGVKYDKTGRDVPTDIAEYLNLGSIEVGGDKFNLSIHPQFQKPLLMEFSQKRVMDILSASKGLEDLKFVQNELAAEKSKCKGSIETLDTLLENENNALICRNNIAAECTEIFNRITDTLGALECAENETAKVVEFSQLLDSVEEITTEGKILGRISELGSEYSTVNEDLKQQVGLLQLVSKETILLDSISLLERIDSLSSTLQDRSRDTEQLSTLHRLVSTDLQDRITVLEKIAELGSRLNEASAVLDKLSRVTECYSNVSRLSRDIERLSNIVDGEICPVCGKPFEYGHSEDH